MIKLTQHYLDKLQDLLTQAGYTVRHEKGNFKSGSCVVETGKLIVLNKFSPVETKVSYLIEALHTLPIDEASRFDNLTVLSIAPLLARAVREVFEDGSVTSLFNGAS